VSEQPVCNPQTFLLLLFGLGCFFSRVGAILEENGQLQYQSSFVSFFFPRFNQNVHLARPYPHLPSYTASCLFNRRSQTNRNVFFHTMNLSISDFLLQF
jgi:hypothetical protein